MSVSLIYTIASASQKVSIYYGIPVLIGGLLGGFLNIIVFLSLQTFRQSSCAFYLSVMSFVNIGQLFTGLLSRIMITGFLIDWTQTSVFYCKFRYFLFQTCTLISFTCICLAIIDQFFATCSHIRLQQWCNLKVAHRLTALFSIIWTLHGILYLVFCDVYQPSLAVKPTCTIINAIFSHYHKYCYLFILTSCLPTFITILFGFMVYRNAKQLAYRTVPLVRRELDKQLTTMVLVQTIVSFFTVLPYTILSIIDAYIDKKNDLIVQVIIQFSVSMSIFLYYMNFASPFYIYICVSERFRRQLIHVLFNIHLNRWRHPRIASIQVETQL